MDWERIAADFATTGVVPTSEWEAFKAWASDETVPADERLAVMRPYVMTEWEGVNGQMQELYEECLCGLDDGDPRVREFYEEFGVGEDGTCACRRRCAE